MTGADNEKGTAAPGHASRGPVPQAGSLPEGESLGMLLFEMTAQGVVCQDPTGIVSANPAAQRIFGLTWEQMQGRATGNPDWHIIHEDGTVFPADEQPGMMALRTGREVRDIVLAVVNPQDLSRRWLNVTAKPLFRHGESTPFRCLVLFDDITERRRIEETLRANEKEWLALLEVLPVGVSILDEHQAIKTFNPALGAILGLTVEGLQDGVYRQRRYLRSDGTPMPPEEFPSVRAQREQQTIRAVPIGVIKDDGSTAWTEVSAAPLSLPNASCVTVTTDITERRHSESLLSESSERLREAHELAHIGVWEWDPLDDTVTWTQELYRIAGLDPALPAPTYQEHPNLYSLESWALLKSAVERAMETGEAYQLELELIRPDGEARHLNAFGGAKFNAKGQVDRLYGTVHDITEKKRAAEALHESEEIFRMLFQSVNDALFVSELDDQGILGQFILVNDTACQRLGYSREELLARTPADINSDHSRPSINARIRKVLAERCTIVESEHVTKDGRIIPVEISTSVATLRNKTVFCSLARDITERKQAETVLMQSEALMRTAIENLPLIFYMIDSEGIFRLSVGAGLKGLGLEQNQVCGLSAFEIYRDFPEITNAIREALAGNAATFESRVSGSSYSNICVPFRASNTGFSGLVAVALDITERKAAEEQNARIEGQLHQAQKMEAVGRLAGGVAHDFNNMLGAILGHVELAMAEVDSTQSLYADLQEIQTAARRSADLTRQLLGFARKQTVAPKVIDLNQTVEGMLKMLRRLIGEDIELTWNPDADLWPVKLDPAQADQILANLCVNARDAIADVGKLTIETGNRKFDEDYCANHTGYVAGDYVQLAVSDNGSGMDKQTLARLFEPFFTTKELGKGTGLGLATVYGIVKQNSGFINVYSEPGQGTTFKIYLPRYVGDGRLAAASAARPAARGNETILLVEDEPSILNMTKRILERQGYSVVTASTPGEAIYLAREYPSEIHLLVTDVVMPEMNGRALAKQLLSLFPGLKCLFMSGYTANAIAHHGVLDEGVCFIQKPFSKEDLAAKVRQLLDSGNEAES